MTTSTEERKERHLRELARGYEDAGYRVILHPDRAARPSFLAEFVPDLLAIGTELNIVGMVRLREELIGDAAFLQLAEVVDTTPGWRLDIEVIPPVTPPVVSPAAQEMTAGEVQVRLTTARSLSAAGEQDSALLIAWSALETSLRQLAEEYDTEIDRPQPTALIQRLVWLGLLDQGDYARLQRALRYRNLTAHGFRAEGISAELVEEIIAQVERLQQPRPHHAIA
jgi:hypothetical protein